MRLCSSSCVSARPSLRCAAPACLAHIRAPVAGLASHLRHAGRCSAAGGGGWGARQPQREWGRQQESERHEWEWEEAQWPVPGMTVPSVYDSLY